MPMAVFGIEPFDFGFRGRCGRILRRGIEEPIGRTGQGLFDPRSDIRVYSGRLGI